MKPPRTEPALPATSSRPRSARALIALAAFLAALGTACANRPAAGAPSAPAGTPPPAAASPTSAATSTPRVEATGTPAASGTATGTPSATPRPSTTAVPAASGTPAPATPPRAAFEVQVDPPFVGQGETLLVRAIGVAGGTVSSGGRTVPLLSAPTGAWAVIGVGLYSGLGATTVTVTGRDEQGGALGDATARYTVVDPKRPADYLVTTEETAAILTPEAGATETRLRGEQFAAFDATPRWRTAFRHPVLGFEVSTQFGSGRSINGGPVGDFHSGEDLAVDEGVAVTAAAPGRVSWVGAMPIRGNSVIVDHGGGVKTGYHHLLDTTAVVGQQVEAGALLGHVGSTGFSTGPHLHWELTIFGVNVDPETWTTRAFPR